MLDQEQVDDVERAIGLSTIHKVCKLLGYEPSRTISITLDAKYVYAEFITSDGGKVAECLEVDSSK